MARKPHPYFGFVARCAPAAIRLSGRRSLFEPSLNPDQEEGVLWDALRSGRNPTGSEEGQSAATGACLAD